MMIRDLDLDHITDRLEGNAALHTQADDVRNIANACDHPVGLLGRDRDFHYSRHFHPPAYSALEFQKILPPLESDDEFLDSTKGAKAAVHRHDDAGYKS